MTRGQAKVTFLGPLSRTRGKWSFLLMQGQASPLHLEYEDHASAIAARRQLLQTPNTHSDQSVKLLQGVQQAIQQAYEEGKQSSTDDQSEGTEDVSRTP